jgi:ribosome biogenesis protein UTP30
LPVPIYSADNQTRFAVISSDPARAYKDKIENLNLPCVAKVIGYSKLKKNYPTYNDKRKLAYEFDGFFCDYKIYNLLRKPLGKVFYERKKYVFPVIC